MRGLYAIADVDFLSQRQIEPLAFVEAVLSVRPAALQLRAKSLGPRDTLSLLRAVQALGAAQNVPIFANDRPDLALLAGCHGVHLGQNDLGIADTKRLAPQLAVGLSTHRLEELDLALLERPAYIAFGPVFATSSKLDTEPVVGLIALAEASRRCRAARVPLVAIGGLSLDRAALIAQSADAGAVISALLPALGLPGVARAAALLHQALGGGSHSAIAGAGER